MQLNSETLRQIEKTKEYIEYLEKHILYINQAWDTLKDKCGDMPFIYDDYSYFTINQEILNHDLSKLSESEFVQYRKHFYPTEKEGEYDISKAWNHHKKHNPHHWEKWTDGKESEWVFHCVHMVCDWMAMGYMFGDTAQEYYERHKDEIKIPQYAIDFIYQIFNRVYEGKE